MFGTEQIITNSQGISFTCVDIDMDNDIDILHQGYLGFRILSNDGFGNFVPLPQIAPNPGGSTLMEIGDINSDNDLDIIYSFNSPYFQLKIWAREILVPLH